MGGYKVDIRESEDGVNEFQETVLTMGPVEKPGGVEEEREGGFTLCVMFKEILCENLLDGVGIFCVETSISH